MHNTGAALPRVATEADGPSDFRGVAWFFADMWVLLPVVEKACQSKEAKVMS